MPAHVFVVRLANLSFGICKDGSTTYRTSKHAAGAHAEQRLRGKSLTCARGVGDDSFTLSLRRLENNATTSTDAPC